MLNNTHGSVWRKWDLHIHTPGTAKNDQFGQLNNSWPAYIQRLENCSDISVFGITDYFSMDNYLKLKDNQINNNKLTDKLLLPNIELRITPVTSSNTPINIHVIFDPTLDTNLIEREFLRKLQFTRNNERYCCIKSDIVELGRQLFKSEGNNNTIDEDAAWKKGIDQYVVDFNEIRNALQGGPLTGRYLIGVSNNSGDGNSGIQDSSLRTLREEIYKFANFIFSSNESDVKYFLGEGIDTEDEVIKKCGSLKPCITGSDAHKLDDICKFPNNRFTWIKADTSFEGLKQIIYEPKERIRIQESMPEQKNDYQVIESISFDNSEMGKQTIYFNQNLNTIIGGRSSGKSILLGSIAKLIQKDISIKGLLSEGNNYEKYVTTKILHNATLKWRDNIDDMNRDIEYFPQSQINNITNNQNEINNIIDKIVKIKNNAKLKEYEDFCTKNQAVISKLIVDYFKEIKLMNDNEISLKEIGNEKGIKEQISKIKNKSMEIKNKLNINGQNKEKYELQNEQIDNYKKEKEIINNYIDCLIGLRQDVMSIQLDYDLDILEDDKKQFLYSKFKEIISDANTKWNEVIDSIIHGYKVEYDDLDKNIQTILLDPNYIMTKEYLSNNNTYNKIELELSEEMKKINAIEEYKKEIEKHKLCIVGLQNKIIEYNDLYFVKMSETIQNINILNNDISIEAEARFDINQFMSVLENSIDMRTVNAKDYKLIKYLNNNKYNEMRNNIYTDIIDDKIQLKSSYDKQQIITDLFVKNYYSINYNVIFERDPIEQMSEGKKAFVVLRLLLDFSSKKCPILIDQPEDDLDNRAIYDQLVQYLRTKKKERQIILVTHNPNIVIGADAELVIVANQHGEQNKNDNSVKFEYFGSSLENTKKPDNSEYILNSRGIREHVCEILEGGMEAFAKREQKYGNRV